VPLHEYLNGSAPPAWKFSSGDGDVVIKSGVYLARNFRDYRFPHQADLKELKEVAGIVRKALKNEAMEEISLENLSTAEVKILNDKRMIGICYVNTSDKLFERFIHVKNNGQDVVMVNEEDHALISFKKPGLGFTDLLKKAFKIDDLLDETAEIAYDQFVGYLTSLPARTGTGLRAAALLHLPALAYTRNIKATANIANKLGIDLIPLYGTKEKEWQGNLFLATNHKTIGLPEIDMVKRVESFAREVAASERKGRDALCRYRNDSIDDIVWRAYGLLERSKVLTEKEALDAASKLQLGSDLGVIKKLPNTFFGEVFTLSRTSYLRNLAGSDKDIKHLRAIIANRKLQGVK